MQKLESRCNDLSGEPPPTFATDAEIEMAQRLRREIEARYLAPQAAPPIPPGQPGTAH